MNQCRLTISCEIISFFKSKVFIEWVWFAITTIMIVGNNCNKNANNDKN